MTKRENKEQAVATKTDATKPIIDKSQEVVPNSDGTSAPTNTEESVVVVPEDNQANDYTNVYGEGSTAPKSVDWVGYKPKEDAKQGADLSKVGDYKESLYAPSAKKTPEEERKQRAWDMEKTNPWLKDYDSDEGIDWPKVYKDNPDLKPSAALRLAERYADMQGKSLTQSDFLSIIGNRDPNKSANEARKDRKRALWATAIDQIGNIAFNAVNAFAIGADPKGLYTPTTFGEKMQAKDEEMRKQNLSQYWDAYKAEQKKQEDARILAEQRAYEQQKLQQQHNWALELEKEKQKNVMEQYIARYGTPEQQEALRQEKLKEAKAKADIAQYKAAHSNTGKGGGGSRTSGSGKSKGTKSTTVDKNAASVVPQSKSGSGKIKKA